MQRILLEFLPLAHGIALGYDFPQACNPVAGIIFRTGNEIQVFPLVFKDDGKTAMLRDIFGILFHPLCLVTGPHIPNIFNGDCGNKGSCYQWGG